MPNTKKKKRNRKKYQTMTTLQSLFWIISISAIIMIYLELHIYASMVSSRIRTHKPQPTFVIARRIVNIFNPFGVVSRFFNFIKSTFIYIFSTPDAPVIYEPEVNIKRSHANAPVRNIFIQKPQNTRFQKTMNSIANENMAYCFGNLHIYNADLVVVENVILVTSELVSSRKGGEKMEDVLGQDEASESIRVRRGFLRLPCNSIPQNKLPRNSEAYLWYQAMVPLNSSRNHIESLVSLENTSYLWSPVNETENQTKSQVQDTMTSLYSKNRVAKMRQFTILVRRGDYANLYWTLIDIFNVFLTVRMCGEHENNTLVLLLDAHPTGLLDPLWTRVFDNVIRVGHIKNEVVLFRKMAWNIVIGPIRQSIRDVPYTLEFKNAVMKESAIDNICNAKGKPIVTFILRRDYVAHPRNMNGKIKRKIANEKSLIEYLNRTLTNITLLPVQLDKLDMTQQLHIIKKTWVLIGVHGAGLGFGFLLTPGATVIELFPASYRGAPNPHFQQIASYGRAHYKSWYAHDAPKGDEFIQIPLAVAESLIRDSLSYMCDIIV